jgi:hypothetical protein
MRIWKLIIDQIAAMLVLAAARKVKRGLAEAADADGLLEDDPKAEELCRKAVAYLGEQPPALPAPPPIPPESSPPLLSGPTPHLNGDQPRRPRGRPRKHPLPPSETHQDLLCRKPAATINPT